MQAGRCLLVCGNLMLIHYGGHSAVKDRFIVREIGDTSRVNARPHSLADVLGTISKFQTFAADAKAGAA
jgi:hypothetical protein